MGATRDIDQTLAVAAQPTEADLVALARNGVRTIINNRPDGEEPGQWPARAAAARARELGLSYHHLPVTSSGMSVADAEAFAAVVAGSDGRVVAHCRSGTRSANLRLLGRLASGDLGPADAVRWGAEHRVDVGAALAALARHRNRDPGR